MRLLNVRNQSTIRVDAAVKVKQFFGVANGSK